MLNYGKGEKHTKTGYNDLITRPHERTVDTKHPKPRRTDSMESAENEMVRRRFQEV